MATKPQKMVSQVVARPAPIGGLNARDSLANMSEMDAVRLINWVPDSGGVRCRKGYREWAINFTGAVKSVFPYYSPTSGYPTGAFLTNPTTMPGTLFAATDNGIYDITSETSAPALSRALGGLTNSGWLSSTMLSNGAGSFLLVASEADGYFHYDGTVWTTVTMGAGAGQISGVNPNTFCHVNMWKRRAWFVQKNTMKAWYLPVDSIAGAASAIDFGPLFKKGGHLAYTANWTIDAGEGIDDFLVGVSSNGEIAVYKGSDPASASTFALVGTWQIGQIPTGRRGYCQYGGDLVLLGADGIYPISYVTRGGAGLLQASGQEYSSKIRALIGPALKQSFTEFGWDMLLHPTERLLVVNVPNVRGYKNAQFAMSTTLNQWAIFQDVPMQCFGSTGGYSFAGTPDGKVLLLYVDALDAVEFADRSSGNFIYGVVIPAFSNFKAPAQDKMFVMLRAHFLSSGTVGLDVSIAVNYALPDIQLYPSGGVDRSSRFDSARFNQNVWSGLNGIRSSEWVGVGAVGSVGAAVLQTAAIGDSVLSAIDYMYQVGGPL